MDASTKRLHHDSGLFKVNLAFRDGSAETFFDGVVVLSVRHSERKHD
jgi:hypothetical protein